MTGKLTVLNPMGFPPKVEGKPLAPSLEVLDGRTICLVDGNFDNADAFMRALEGWFRDNLPSVKTEIVQWREPFADDPEASRRIGSIADAAIFGVGI